ncbi:hypothetical protein TNIN_277501 [Trichonephila inaurata madagascariensis]|uniref:Uncharacterized protein n=1 Tax=Trichonephila inaurata madagascariensis TaxID=2747483 RepID=A0A8X6WS90_9ARAC|nr:hypothetical protein TNIN_277501 [Trichonephila inaurata madagascariensis]
MTSAVSKSSLTSRQKQRIGSISPQENTSLFLITSLGFTNYTGELETSRKKNYILRSAESQGVRWKGGAKIRTPPGPHPKLFHSKSTHLYIQSKYPLKASKERICSTRN